MKVLVSGSNGFVGRNLISHLKRRDEITINRYDLGNAKVDLFNDLAQADLIFHLAGVNRPKNLTEFITGNAEFTEDICNFLKENGRAPKIIFSSSIQVGLDNPYAYSKQQAEEALIRYSEATGAECVVYRLKHLFGKWCRPNYNSVTATFCYNIAHSLPIQISDEFHEIELTYIDDVMAAFINELYAKSPGFRFAESLPSHRISLGELAQTIRSFRDIRDSLHLPNFSQAFFRALYATYLSYLDETDFVYDLENLIDQRGSLAEFIKAPFLGQLFVSRTKPGITRGDHYHHTKTEKFLVVQGKAVIRFRHIESDQIIEYHANGEFFQVVDIPPGYTHSIENIGENDLVTLFWVSEMFDSERPDTFFDPVLKAVGDQRP
jgi:UDP-2-acetamido-2,6-beta-L-arabino-hexul-4-ose reductase